MDFLCFGAHMRFYTCRGKIVEDVSELEGAVADAEIWSEVVMANVGDLWSLGLLGGVTFHDLGTSLPRQRSQ